MCSFVQNICQKWPSVSMRQIIQNLLQPATSGTCVNINNKLGVCLCLRVCVCTCTHLCKELAALQGSDVIKIDDRLRAELFLASWSLLNFFFLNFTTFFCVTHSLFNFKVITVNPLMLFLSLFSQYRIAILPLTLKILIRI